MTKEILIQLGTQRLQLWEGDRLLREYPVSTSRYGPGFEEGSLQTPTGRFIIAEKIGAGAPLRAVFRQRQPTGDIHKGGGEEDAILTRILWLDGLEPANAKTFRRYIYIHGTNREDLLGQPASQGCIRMANADVAELFELVEEGTKVLIT